MKRIITLWLAVLMLAAHPVQAAVCVGFGQSADVTYLVNEGFEGTGAPTAPGTWTTSGDGTINFDATATPIEGSQYLHLDYGTAHSYVHIPLGASYDEVYIGMKIRFNSFPSVLTNFLSPMYNTSNVGYLYTGDGGEIRAFPAGGATATSADGIITAGTPIYIKTYYKKSDGSNNGTMTAWTSSDGSTWTQIVSNADGTNTNQINYINLFVNNAAIEYDVDSFKVSTSNFNY